MTSNSATVFRFAPSPNGELHLGHAYSASLNFQMAKQTGGQFLLRIEDIDTERCRPDLETQMLHDLEWLGIEWNETPRRQSEHFETYRDALDTLEDAGLIYPAFMSRREIKTTVENWGASWKTDPDGVPIYPGDEKNWSDDRIQQMQADRPTHTKRLDMQAACHHVGSTLHWEETGSGPEGETGLVEADPQAWGDVVLGRSDTPTSYHLSVVVDDALQGVTNIVRGQDLFWSTSIHRLLQELLGLPQPQYHHHRLITDDQGHQLSKSQKDTSIRALREAGLTPDDIRRLEFDDQ